MIARAQGGGGEVPSAQEETGRTSRAGNRFRSTVFNCCGGPRLSILIADARSRDFHGAPRSWNGENASLTIKCPSCSSTDWLSVARGERHYLRCLDCGQIKFLPVRNPPSEQGPSILPVDLFSATDSAIGTVIT